VACFFLPSYRVSLLLSFPRSMATDFVFFVAAILMAIAVIGLLLWFLFL
jgi:hypothetical protein